MGGLASVAIVAFALLSSLAAPAGAEPPDKILVGNGDIECTTQGPGPYEGQTWCGTGVSSPGNVSSTPGVGGVPIDVNVALPATGEAPYPVVLVNHGNGEQKFNFDYGASTG